MRMPKNPLEMFVWGALAIAALVVFVRVIWPLIAAVAQIILVMVLIAAALHGVRWLMKRGKHQNR